MDGTLEALKNKVEELKKMGFDEGDIVDAMREWLDEIHYRDW